MGFRVNWIYFHLLTIRITLKTDARGLRMYTHHLTRNDVYRSGCTSNSAGFMLFKYGIW
jgi:hypothetical protein